MTRNKEIPGSMDINPMLSHNGQVEVAVKLAHLSGSEFVSALDAELIRLGKRASDDTMFPKHVQARAIYLANLAASAPKALAAKK